MMSHLVRHKAPELGHHELEPLKHIFSGPGSTIVSEVERCLLRQDKTALINVYTELQIRRVNRENSDIFLFLNENIYMYCDPTIEPSVREVSYEGS